jgi:ribonuclease BN (tRNA processing enzyme)
VCPQFAVAIENVFITHAHLDHLSSLPIHAQQRTFLSRPPATYYLPPNLIPGIEMVLQGFTLLDPGRIKYSLKPLVAREGPLAKTAFQENSVEEIKLTGGIIVRPFKTLHRVESQGYSFWKVTSTLKDEYKLLSNEAIREKIKVVYYYYYYYYLLFITIIT